MEFKGFIRPLVSLPLYVVTLELSPRASVALVVLFVISAVHIRGLGPGRRGVAGGGQQKPSGHG